MGNPGSGHPCLRICIAVLLLGIILVAPAAADQGWKFRSDNQNTGEYDGGGLLPDNHERWNVTTGWGIDSSPAIVNEVVYFTSGGRVYACNASDGTEKWNSTLTAGTGTSSPAVTEGTVYVGAGDQYFYALYAVNGTVRWKRQTSGEWPCGDPAVLGDLVYAKSNDALYAFYTANGTQKWREAASMGAYGGFYSSPAVSNGVVFIGGNDEQSIRAYDALTGTSKWTVYANGKVRSSPAVVNGMVYIGSDDDKVRALDATSGTEIWNFTTGGDVESSPAVVNGTVYIGSAGKKVYALNATNGQEKWNCTTKQEVHSSPAVADGILYVGDYYPRLYAIYTSNGTEKWYCDPSDYSAARLRSSPAISNGVVYVGDGRDTFHAIGSTNTPPAPIVPSITSITPTSGSAGSSVSVTITGSNFPPAASARVNLSQGSTNISGTGITVTGSSEIKCTFNVPSGATPGPWDLLVTNTTSGMSGTRTGAFTVTSGPAPKFSSINPTSGLLNTTVAFSITGNNFLAGSVVNFTNTTYGNVTWIPGNITKTKITGSVLFPSSAPTGKWDVVVIVPDGRNATKTAGFKLKGWDKPKVTSVTPASGYQNSTTTFTLSGSNFQAGAVVNFSHASYGNVTAELSSVVPAKIKGRVTFPKPAIEEKWDITVTTPDGGQSAPKEGAFTLKSWPQPKISSLVPTKGLVNTTFNFTITGDYFEPGSQVRFEFSSTDTVPATTTSVTLTKVQGYVTFNATVPTGRWRVVVLPPDADYQVKEALTLNGWNPPKVSSITPTSGLRNTTVAFSLTGTNFQQGAVVNFSNATYPGGNLTTATNVISSTKITGNLEIPYDAPAGKWNIIVTTPDGGQGAPKTNAFTVKEWSKPTVSSVNPAKGKHGTTLNYAITGTNFQPGSTVTFTNTSAPGLNFTAGVNTLTMTKITGSVDIPADRTGKYGIEVLCPDGKTGKKDKAFTLT